METPTERIDRWIKEEGQGNARDALNVALCRLDRFEGMILNLKEDNQQLNHYISGILTTEEIAHIRERYWHNFVPQPNHPHHVECECNLCTYGREAVPANEY